MATSKSKGAGSFWSICGKRGCGRSVKASPDRTNAGGKSFHKGHEPKGFVAVGKSFKVTGYRQEKWGDKETSTPKGRALAAKRAKAEKSSAK